MKKSLLILLIAVGYCNLSAQRTVKDSLQGFDENHFMDHLNTVSDRQEIKTRLEVAKRNFIKAKYFPAVAKTFPLSSASSTCGNFDFEDGNVGGWTISGDFQVMSGTGVDPYGGFPVVCPGGNFSLRLNDDNVNASTCSPPGTKTAFNASASRTLAITAMNSIINVNYAGVILYFPHPQNAAANVRIQFYDQFNNLIASPSYSACYANPPGSFTSNYPTSSATSTVPAKQVCNYGTYPSGYYPWQTQSFNLSAYIGQTISIKLSADWCLYQYDWGYAYFDVCCDNSNCTKLALNVNETETETLQVYPNPAKNVFHIEGKLKGSELVVFDCIGNQVIRKQLSSGKNSIDTESLAPGLYLYSIYSQGKPIKQGKLVKE
jgi:hypothetical protein